MTEDIKVTICFEIPRLLQRILGGGLLFLAHPVGLVNVNILTDWDLTALSAQ